MENSTNIEKQVLKAKVIGCITLRDLLNRLNKNNSHHWKMYTQIEDAVLAEERKQLLSMPKNTSHVGAAFLKALLIKRVRVAC